MVSKRVQSKNIQEAKRRQTYFAPDPMSHQHFANLAAIQRLQSDNNSKKKFNTKKVQFDQ